MTYAGGEGGPGGTPPAPPEKLVIFPSGVDIDYLAKKILKNEPKIIDKYPPFGYRNKKTKTIWKGEYTDGGTSLGLSSLTSRFCHFNILHWWGTKKLSKRIRDGYERYTDIKGTPLYVQCWANVMREGDRIAPHVHTEGKQTPVEKFLSGHLNVQVDSTTATYYKTIQSGERFVNKPGEMTFFPGYMMHYTDVYRGSGERITIAFDIFSEDYFNESKSWFDAEENVGRDKNFKKI